MEETDGVLYIFENERHLQVMICRDNVKNPHLTSRYHIIYKNKGIPLMGNMSLSYAIGEQFLDCDKAFSCSINNLDDLLDDIEYLKRTAFEVEQLMEGIEKGLY